MARHRAKNLSNDSTRELLITAARKLFALHGYKATTVKDIAEKAGVNISLISYHFDGKEKLYHECVDKHGTHLLEMASKVLKPGSSGEEFRLRVKMFIEECLLDFVKDPELCLMAYREAETFHPAQNSALNQDYLKFYQKIIEYIEQGKLKSFVDKNINAHLAAGVLFGGISHFVKMDRIREKEFGRSIKDLQTRNEAIQHLSSIFLNGILVKPK